MSKTRKWYTRPLYLVFALALVVGLTFVPATPVSATSVSQPSVTVETKTISTASKYTITFDVTSDLDEDSSDYIEVRFPSNTTVPTTWADADVTLKFTKGDWGGNEQLTAAAVGDKATTSTRTVKITLDDAHLPVAISDVLIGAGASVEVVFVEDEVLNPSTVGDYTLEVCTSADTTWKTSASYTIKAPATAGVVSVYNASDVLMASFTGENALDDCRDGATNWFTKANYTIEVSAATYTPTGAISISGSGLTFKSTDGAASTIIEGSAAASHGIIEINAPNVTIGGSDCGFTIKGKSTASTWSAVLIGGSALYTKPTIQGNIITGKLRNGIWGRHHAGIAYKATIKDNTVSPTLLETTDSNGIGVYLLAGSVIDNNEVSGFGAGISLYGPSSGGPSGWADAITVSNNTCYGNTYEGIGLDPGLIYVVVSGNDCYDNTTNGIAVCAHASTDFIKVVNNNLYNNKESGLQLYSGAATQVYVFGNNIYGNTSTVGTTTGNDYGILNSGTGTVPATHNWWGDATGPSGVGPGSGDAVSSGVTYSPWLEASVSAAALAHGTATGVTSLNAKATVGVQISGLPTDVGTDNAIGAALYAANPKATPTFTVVENSYTDVYVNYGADTIGTTNEVILKFSPAGMDENSVVYAWNETLGTWQECTHQDYSSYAGGYVWAKVHSELNTTAPTTPTIEALAGLPFVVGTEVAVVLDVAYYDEDGSGLIEIDELLNAISDYIGGVPGADISLLLDVISAYINETAV